MASPLRIRILLKNPPKPFIAALTLKNNNERSCVRFLSGAGGGKSKSGSLKSTLSVSAFNLKDSKSTAVVAVPTDKSESSESKANLDRNFITAVRAMHDFLLTPEQLEGLRVTKRRSALAEKAAHINVYWRRDVEAKSLAIWGSPENLAREKESRLAAGRDLDAHAGTVQKWRVRWLERRKPLNRKSWPVRNLTQTTEEGLESPSGKVVIAAIAINTANFGLKLLAWMFTGSHAMFSEAIHSAADTGNQIILAYGLQKSARKADQQHPYGYTNMQYVSSLISGVGIFCLGAGLSMYHGIEGLMSPHSIESVQIAVGVLIISFASESVTLALAINSIRERAKACSMGFFDFVVGGYDPCVNVVLLEDAAAVLGVVIAASAMGLSVYTGSHYPDALGSIAIGGLLGTVATFMITTNTNVLVGKSVPQERLDMINARLEGDIMVRQLHDVKGIDMGNGIIRYKAEIDVDGRALAQHYMRLRNLDVMLSEVQGIKTKEDLELFMLNHGENVVDCLGEQVDRIEKELRKHHPELKHVDLEVL